MADWNTEKMKVALSKLGDVRVESQGGDYDTNNLYVYPKGQKKGDCISVIGFRPGNGVTTPSDVKNIEGIEVRNFNSDSRGGLQSSNEKICILYGRIVAHLRKQGFSVVPHYDCLF